MNEAPGPARFTARVEAVARGGHFVIVPIAVVAALGLAHRARVRGQVNGVPLRSAIMKAGATYHLGVHKAVLTACGARAGDEVALELARDDAPLPGDTVPPDVVAALAAADPKVRAAFGKLPPSHRREHINAILDAKRPETRAKRVALLLAACAARVKAPRARGRA